MNRQAKRESMIDREGTGKKSGNFTENTLGSTLCPDDDRRQKYHFETDLQIFRDDKTAGSYEVLVSQIATHDNSYASDTFLTRKYSIT